MNRALLSRIFDYYGRYSPDSGKAMSVVWSTISRLHQGPLHTALLNRDTDKAEYLFEHMFDGDLLYGVAGFPQNQDNLRLLCVSVGVLPMPNISQPDGEHDLEAALTTIKDVIAVELTGANQERLPVYANAWVSATRRLGGVPRRVLEIGGGAGTLGTILAPIHRTKHDWNYTIIDLPYMGAVQAYTLGKLGPDNIWLAGEPATNAPIRLYPATDYGSIGDLSLDLVFNSDSFPEIPEAQAMAYLDLIVRVLDRDGIFYSLNHESSAHGQRRVYDRVKEHGKLKLTSRHPCHMRPGYVEEIYTL